MFNEPHTLSEFLLATNGGRHEGRWSLGSMIEQYAASLAGRLVVQLNEEATAAVMSVYRGKYAAPCYLLLNFDGMPRLLKGATVSTWNEAVRASLHEWLFVYNARSKKSCRPCWGRDLSPAERTFDNLIFEPVRVVPHQKTYDEHLKMKNSKVFHINPFGSSDDGT